MHKARGRPPIDDVLTPAEWRVCHAAQHGLSNAQMAERLGVSVHAIKYHLGNILGKLNLPNKKALRKVYVEPTTPRRPAALPGSDASLTNQEITMNAAPVFGQIGQIARTVRDISQSKSWYELVLELPHLYTFGTLAFFDCAGTRLMLTQGETFNANESILYFRVPDIAATHAALVQKGVEFIAAPHRIHRHEDGTEEWMGFFNDPDGRTLALMAQLRPSTVSA